MSSLSQIWDNMIMQCRLPTDHDLRQWWRWSSITSTAASWKHHGDIYNIACTIYIETMQLKPIYMSNSMNVFKDRSVCVFHQATCTCYKLPFNLNAFKSILNIIEVVFFFNISVRSVKAPVWNIYNHVMSQAISV